MHDEARARFELLFRLAREVIAADDVAAVYDAALDAIARGLDTPRAAVLTYGTDPDMQFRAWRGLSDAYRGAVAGHSPWPRDVRDAEPIVVPDVTADPALEHLWPVLRAEGIAGVAFIPLVSGGRLLGKFMLYHAAPRDLRPPELELARAIADHVAAAVVRFDAVDELRRGLRLNEMFIGILGHDLRNPLNAIVTAAQLALMRSTGEKLQKPLSRILTSSGRMTRMIDQLLDFTRVRVGGRIPIAPRPLDVLPLLRQIVEELEDAYPERALQLEASGGTTGNWDADRLGQVFSNVIGNALQHGEPSAPVTVRVEGQDAGTIRVDVHNVGCVPPQYRDTLFEPMSGGTLRRDGSRGLGLGLYITREIVRAHGGSIVCSSDAVAGTTLSLTLPR